MLNNREKVQRGMRNRVRHAIAETQKQTEVNRTGMKARIQRHGNDAEEAEIECG